MRPLAPLSILDPSWLFLLAGLALVASAVLIPAFDDLTQARHHRDRAVAMEAYRNERLANYTGYLGALDARDETLMRSLAASQLNLTPRGTELLVLPARSGGAGSDVFAQLDPVYTPPEPPTKVGSTLERWAMQPRTRLWVIAFGALCVLVGILPKLRQSA